MKKILLFILPLFILSCSRDGNGSDNTTGKKGFYVKYSVNGTFMQDVEEVNNLDPEKSWFIQSMFSENLSAANGSTYNINLDSNNLLLKSYPLKAGTYTYDDSKNTNVLEMDVFTFYDISTKDTYYYSGQPRTFNDKTTFTINITTVTSSTVKGTFSGSIVAYPNLNSNSNRKILSVTSGEFYLPIEKE